MRGEEPAKTQRIEFHTDGEELSRSECQKSHRSPVVVESLPAHGGGMASTAVRQCGAGVEEVEAETEQVKGRQESSGQLEHGEWVSCGSGRPKPAFEPRELSFPKSCCKSSSLVLWVFG